MECGRRCKDGSWLGKQHEDEGELMGSKVEEKSPGSHEDVKEYHVTDEVLMPSKNHVSEVSCLNLLGMTSKIQEVKRSGRGTVELLVRMRESVDYYSGAMFDSTGGKERYR